MPIEVIDEKSRSRSGLHQRRRFFMVVDSKCKEHPYKIISTKESAATYAYGYLKHYYIEAPDNVLVIQLDFRKNIRGHILGDVIIYDSKGNMLGRAVYRKLKVRLVKYVSLKLVDILKCVFRKLKLPVKKYGVIRS